MRRLLVSLLLAAALSGCADPAAQGTVTGDPMDDVRDANEYWFIWITGRERSDPPPQDSCSVAFSHTVDETARTITHAADHGDLRGQRPQVVIASSVWDPSSCPISYKLQTAGPISVDMEALGTIVVEVMADGDVRVGDQVIKPGQQMSWDASTTKTEGGKTIEYSNELLVRAMGPWPHAGLVAQS